MGSKLLAAGRVDRRVTIVRDGTATVDSWNQKVAGAPVETETWAAVTPAPGTERFDNAENAASAPMRFVLRWRAGLVKVTDRIVHDGRTYEVKSITEIGRREGLEVLAVARGED